VSWLRERVWQLGIGILLAFVAAALVYSGATPEGELESLGLAGFALFVVALAIPLIAKAVEAAQELLDEDV
jgi:hypothetical protein